MTKLSPVQEAILRRMGEGPVPWSASKAANALDNEYGFIKTERLITDDGYRLVDVITPAGRAYLEGLE